MARKLFVDSSGWYALIDRRDAWHESAKRQVDKLVRDGGRLITTDYIVDESCTLATARAGSVAAVRLLDLLDKTQAVEWEWIGTERFARSAAFFRKHRDHGYSFTDCTSFVLMRESRLDEALTSDTHFRKAGFKPTLA